MSPKRATDDAETPSEEQEPPTAVEPQTAPEEPTTDPAPYEAKVVDLPDDEQSEQETPHIEIPGGHDALVYKGAADLYEHEGFSFRHDQPVIVPSDVALDLLTTPNEHFARVDADLNELPELKE